MKVKTRTKDKPKNDNVTYAIPPKEGKPDFITACPYCYAKDPNPPRSYLAFDPKKPGIVICEREHGEVPITDKILNAPKFYFSHYED